MRRRESREMRAHMTISFSYVYLNGLERRMVSSPSVDICVHLPRRAMSPLITIRTDD